MNVPQREFPVLEERILLPALLDDATRMNFMRFCELIELAAPDLPSLGYRLTSKRAGTLSLARPTGVSESGDRRGRVRLRREIKAPGDPHDLPRALRRRCTHALVFH